MHMKTFLHVGCGPKRKDRTTRGFNDAQWNELRLDIDPAVAPDIVGTMTDMGRVADASVDAGFPPLMLDPIDFAGLYMQQQGQLAGQPPAGQA